MEQANKQPSRTSFLVVLGMQVLGIVVLGLVVIAHTLAWKGPHDAMIPLPFAAVSAATLIAASIAFIFWKLRVSLHSRIGPRALLSLLLFPLLAGVLATGIGLIYADHVGLAAYMPFAAAALAVNLLVILPLGLRYWALRE